MRVLLFATLANAALLGSARATEPTPIAVFTTQLGLAMIVSNACPGYAFDPDGIVRQADIMGVDWKPVFRAYMAIGNMHQQLTYERSDLIPEVTQAYNDVLKATMSDTGNKVICKNASRMVDLGIVKRK